MKSLLALLIGFSFCFAKDSHTTLAIWWVVSGIIGIASTESLGYLSFFTKDWTLSKVVLTVGAILMGPATFVASINK